MTRLIDARGKLDRTQIEELLRQEIEAERAHGIQYWPVFLLSDRQHVGCCGLRQHRPGERTYEVGIHLRSEWWSRGLASEAVSAVVSYAFDRLEASGVFAGHHPENDASRRLLEGLGFRYTHDEYYAPTGLEHPSYMLRSREWSRRFEQSRRPKRG